MKTKHVLIGVLLVGAVLIAGCAPDYKVGALQSESQSVELGDARSVRVDVNFGAGDLDVTRGAGKLLDADFTYNVAKLKPEVTYTNGTLVVNQPEAHGMPNILGVAGFRNEWGLRLDDDVPMALHVAMGAGTSRLQLAGLSLTGLDVDLGAGTSTIDLSGDWARDFSATIDSGAADITVRLPKNIGVRVEVDRGPTAVVASGLTEYDDVYTNAAYGKSDVTMRIHMQAGIGVIRLEVADAVATGE